MIKKLSLSLVAASIAAISYGQTIVSTNPENKNVVLEEFTGIYCGFCPDGHAIAQAIQNANPGRVSLINIHVGGFAAPGPGDPDFRTPFGNAIANQSRLTGYPAGQVNRHIFAGRGMASGATAMGRNYWAASADEILQMPSYVNVGVEATIDLQSREITVHVEAYYTGDSPENTNLLNIALLQNNTVGPQSGGGTNYTHMHRLVHLLTGQWGEEITTTTQGTFVDRTYTYTIPEDYNSIPAVLEDMEVVAFISETHQEIPTGKNAKPYYTGLSVTNDASIQSIHEIAPKCNTNLSPVINIANYGQNPLTNLTINYEINGSSYSYDWTGNIPALWDEDIELPEVNFEIMATNTITVSLPDDEDNSNNSKTATFAEAVEGTGTINMQIKTDRWGYEFSWDLKNSAGEIVESGDTYPSNQVINLTFDIPEDCYTLNIYDEAGDGGTMVSVKDSDGTNLFFKIGNWGSKFSGEFSSNGVLGIGELEIDGINLYPNPANDILNITNAENADVQVFDILGKLVISKENISLNEQLNVSGLNAGSYFVKVSKEGNVTTKKLLITK